MPRISVSNSFTEDEIKSWGDPPSWAQGKSLGSLDDATFGRILAFAISKASSASGNDEALWEAVMSIVEDQVGQFDGDDKVIYLGFGHLDYADGAAGANAPHAAYASSELLDRSWTAGVMWR